MIAAEISAQFEPFPQLVVFRLTIGELARQRLTNPFWSTTASVPVLPLCCGHVSFLLASSLHCLLTAGVALPQHLHCQLGANANLISFVPRLHPYRYRRHTC